MKTLNENIKLAFLAMAFVDVGHTVCPYNVATLIHIHSWQPCQPPNISSHINYGAKHSSQFNYKYVCTKMPQYYLTIKPSVTLITGSILDSPA